MKVHIDDSEQILKELVSLYMELPEDLRTTDELIPASHLIFEAKEFIKFLKDSTALRNAKTKLNRIIDDPWSLYGSKPRHRGTQTSMVTTGHQTATTKQTIINPTSLLQQRKIIHTVTPDGKSMEHSTTIKQILPKNIDNSIGTHFLAASNNSTPTAVASESPKLMSNVNGLKSPPGQGGLNKPITIMAKDPNTGAMRPVTLYPKNVTKNPGGITTIQLAPNPSNISVANASSPSPIITSPNAPRLKPGVPILVPNVDNRNLSPFSEDIASLRLPALVSKTSERNQFPVRPEEKQEEHGLICKDGCHCYYSREGASIPEKIQTRIWHYLRQSLKLNSKDNEILLTYKWIQDDIFSNLLQNLPRALFFKFCRIVNKQNNINGEKKQCILIKKRCKNLINGMFFIKGQNYAIPSVLVKLFQEGYESTNLQSLAVESLPNCEMTNDAMMKRNYLCINPYHFGFEQGTPGYSSNPALRKNHLCRKNLKLLSMGSSLETVCRICHKVQSENDFVGNKKNNKNMSMMGDLTSSNIRNTTLKIKTEITEETKNNEVSIEELDQDFESMLQSIEDQVECEVEQVLEGQPETEIQEDINNVDDDITDTKEHLNFDFGPAAKRKKPLEDATNNINPAKKAKKQVKKHPDGKPFQCWQCLIWFANKSELSSHSCLMELNITGSHIYCCHFCATVSDDLDQLRPHVAQCKKFNLGPLKCFYKFESAKTSTLGSSKSSAITTPTRSSRNKKADSQPSICDSCEIKFPSKSDLVLHNSKSTCKHFTCEKCKNNYANERTLKSHPCDDGNISDSVSVDKDGVDQDIKVIKLDRNKLNHQPVKCHLCEKLLQSYELLKAHQTLPNHCGTCKEPFKTTCQLLQHKCQGEAKNLIISNTASMSNKKIKIKTEIMDDSDESTSTGGGPRVILKNVSDDDIPMVKNEMSSVASKKKIKIFNAVT